LFEFEDEHDVHCTLYTVKYAVTLFPYYVHYSPNIKTSLRTTKMIDVHDSDDTADQYKLNMHI